MTVLLRILAKCIAAEITDTSWKNIGNILLILLSVVASLETRFYGVTQMDLLACLLTYSGNSEIYVAMIVNIHIH